ncbi:hypothetical protein QAD02_023094, partial [Eretmocerus hayati]
GTSHYEQDTQHGLDVPGTSSGVLYDGSRVGNSENSRNLASTVHESQSDRTTHQCDDCGRNFLYSCHLKNHMRKHAVTPLYSCDICEKRFNERNNLDRHMLTHSEVRAFKCPTCSSAFKTKCNLLAHMLTHARGRDGTFFCNFCDKRFGDVTDWKSHVRIHLGYMPFTCLLCSKEFKDGNSFLQHMSTHINQEPFMCELCGRKFRNRPSLYHHSRSHCNGRTFTCNFCSRTYRRLHYLTRHVSTKHRNEMREGEDSHEPSGESSHGPNNFTPNMDYYLEEQHPQTSSSGERSRAEFDGRQYETAGMDRYTDWQQIQASGSSSVYQPAHAIQDLNQWADLNSLNYQDRSSQGATRPPESSITCCCSSDCMEGNHCVIDQILGLNNEAPAPVDQIVE